MVTQRLSINWRMTSLAMNSGYRFESMQSSGMRQLVGKTAIYKSEMPAIFAGYLIRIHRKDDLLDGDFLTYFLNSQIALDYGKTVVISSVNQANINGTKLKSYPIPTPSLTEQKTIVKKLDELAQETHRLETIYRQKITVLDDLKKSLLHQAFSGFL